MLSVQNKVTNYRWVYRQIHHNKMAENQRETLHKWGEQYTVKKKDIIDIDII